MRETGIWSHWEDLEVGKIPWRREWQPTPVFLPGVFHGQRSLVGYSPWGRKESDTTEQLTLSLVVKLWNLNSFYIIIEDFWAKVASGMRTDWCQRQGDSCQQPQVHTGQSGGAATWRQAWAACPLKQEPGNRGECASLAVLDWLAALKVFSCLSWRDLVLAW